MDSAGIRHAELPHMPAVHQLLLSQAQPACQGVPGRQASREAVKDAQRHQHKREMRKCTAQAAGMQCWADLEVVEDLRCPAIRVGVHDLQQLPRQLERHLPAAVGTQAEFKCLCQQVEMLVM